MNIRLAGFLGSLVIALLAVWNVGAQITVPHTFTAGTTALSSQVNANFDVIESEALNRTGGTMTGTLTSRNVVPDGNNTRDLGASGTRWANVYGLIANFSGASAFSGVTTFSAANSRGIVASRSGSVDVGINIANSDRSFGLFIEGSTQSLQLRDESDNDPRITFSGPNSTILFDASGGVGNSNYYTSAAAQPGFLAYNGSNETPGAGAVTIVFETEVYDTTSAYNTGTGVFTAPVTGIYQLCANVVGIYTTGELNEIDIITSNRGYAIHLINGTAPATHGGGGCVHADMDASDTALVQVGTVSGATIVGGSSPYDTWFSGRLVP